MLKKRLIGVVTVKNGWAVQSFSYSRYLPLGKPEFIVENLDRWAVDEIFVQVIDRSSADSGPDFKLLERLGALGLGTPLIYAGGIRTVEDGIKLIQLGADRIAVDALLHNDLNVVRELAGQLGAQALIASLPLSSNGGKLEWFEYNSRTSFPISLDVLELIRTGSISEVMVSDWRHEGCPGGFDNRLVGEFPFEGVPLIAFGGLNECEQIRSLLNSPRVAAVAIGNFLSYGEHVVQKYKENLIDMPLRQASYESNFSLMTNV